MNKDVPINKFHWMYVCIKCDKGGNLLTCHENGCPVVVHQDCLGYEAQFDDMGNFCCPYCVYKRATQEFTLAERKAVLAEKVLSKYLDGKGVGIEAFETENVTKSSDIGDQRVQLENDCHEVTGPECITRDKEAHVNKDCDVLLNWAGDNGGISENINQVKVVEKQNELEGVVHGHGDECCSGEGKVDQQKDVDIDRRCQSGNKIQNDAIQMHTAPKQHQDAGHFEAPKIMKENVEALEESEETMDEVQNQEQAHKTTEKIACKESAPQVHMEAKRKVSDTFASNSMDTDTISEKVTGAQPPCVNTPRRSSRKNKFVFVEKSSSPFKSSKVAKPPIIFTKSPTVEEKRKRLAREVEEKKLLKVMEKQNELERVVRGHGDECCSGEVKIDQQKDVNMDSRRQSGDKLKNDAIQTDTVLKQHQDAGHFEVPKIEKENVEAVKTSEGTMDEVMEKQNELERVVRGHGDECCSGEVKIDQQKDVNMDSRRQSGDKLKNDAIQTDTVLKQHQDAGHFEAPKIEKENVEAVKTSEGTMDEVQNQDAPQVHMEAKIKVGDTTASTSMDTNTISEKVTGPQPPCVNTPRRASRKKKSVHIDKSSIPRKPSEVAKPPTIFTMLPTIKEKRKRLAWKVEEEEMLKEAVQKYSKSVNKNLPWQKILEEGRVIFDETRTPTDLKDKWRNILSKEPLFELS